MYLKIYFKMFQNTLRSFKYRCGHFHVGSLMDVGDFFANIVMHHCMVTHVHTCLDLLHVMYLPSLQLNFGIIKL